MNLFSKNIYIVGAQCTGKTTLVDALEAHLHSKYSGCFDPPPPYVIREVARKAVASTGITRKDIKNNPKLNQELQLAILKAQYDTEIDHDTEWTISDRSGLDPIAYSLLYSGREAAGDLLDTAMWKELESRMKRGVVVLCQPVEEWLFDDGTRLISDSFTEWLALHETFKDLLKSRGILYSTMSRNSKDITERVSLILELLASDHGMEKVRSYKTILQATVDGTDNEWVFEAVNLPSSGRTDESGLIKAVSFITNAKDQHIKLHFESLSSNRITRAEPLNKLILVSFAQLRIRTNSGDTSQPAPLRETVSYIERVLKSGITINGVEYHFFGHSNSQLKSRTCFLYAGSKEHISAKVEGMGDFSKLKTVGKKAKRIGLLFSSGEATADLAPERCEDIPDVERDGYNFTDGCGLISMAFTRQLLQQRKIVFRNKPYLPTVIQIRYRGYKGVLTLDPSIKQDKPVRFRDSMRKFKDGKDLSFSIVDYSKPYAFGSLNNEIVLLLHSLGISTETLLRKQQEYIAFLHEVARGEPQQSFRYLTYSNRLELAEKLLIDGIETVQKTIQSLVRQDFVRMTNKNDEQRCKIIIPKSRLLFGVCDPSSQAKDRSKLREGECFLRVTHDSDGLARTVINTEVLVTRNPCLHPGDLQKFRAVDVPQYSHLVDCIVFPTRGKRPSADLMSGGDLDGDKFFVTWDQDIIPSTVAQPASYPAVRAPESFRGISGDDRAEYFARYTNSSMARAAKLHLKWARLKGALCVECQELNRLYSQSVDGARVRIPERLEDPVEPEKRTEKFVLDVLHESSKQQLESMKTGSMLDADCTIDILNILLSRDSLAMSEFEIIQLTLRWCKINQQEFIQFVDLFNFNGLTDQEENFLIKSLPPYQQLPALVRNSLLQSSLMEKIRLDQFGLSSPQMHWRRVFDSSEDDLRRFIPTVSRTMELFHKKLIIYRPDSRLTLAIYIPHRIEKHSEVQVDAAVRVFAIPDSSDAIAKVRPTKVNYKLYCDDSSFQLYEKKRANTWVFLNQSQQDDSSYRNISGEGNRRRAKQITLDEGINFNCRTSVALDKIGKDIQTHIGRVNRAGIKAAEIYVISNRDVRSLNLLDQWLQLIDTDEVVPIYRQTEVAYNAPNIREFDFDGCSTNISRFIRSGDLSLLEKIDSLDEIKNLLIILTHYEEYKIMRQVYSQLTSSTVYKSEISQLELVQLLLEYLPTAVPLTAMFFESHGWKLCKDTIIEEEQPALQQLLKEIVLWANRAPGVIREVFKSCLDNVKQVSVQYLSQLIELISLSVKEPEVALDLLLECIEPQSQRILPGIPLAVSRFVKNAIGIALDHIDESWNARKRIEGTIDLSDGDQTNDFAECTSDVRIDSPLWGAVKQGDHVRLTSSSTPTNRPFERAYTMDAIVILAQGGSMRFRCIHHPPSYVRECAWRVTHCGSFVTSKAMFDAVLGFYGEMESCCPLFRPILGLPEEKPAVFFPCEVPARQKFPLNTSQSQAMKASLQNNLMIIWGPPGTGKTYTITAIIYQLLESIPSERILVTAPTHNAVDNLLHSFVKLGSQIKAKIEPLRVSTNLAKVDASLKQYTCDAMVGKDLNLDSAARRKAEKRVKSAMIVFTTCVGAGIGLLRAEKFPIVVIDEASQLTEPASLIPLTKGSRRAILVGDHVQLRATVQKHAILTEFDVSLFERHTGMPARDGVASVMLDTQYRMHVLLCEYSSTQFYGGRLMTGVADDERCLPLSRFPWPKHNRLVFVECKSPEDLGRQSKSNSGQARLCRTVTGLLTSQPDSPSVSDKQGANQPVLDRGIIVLTPYSRQRELLQSMLTVPVSTIDGYQGREADVVIFVTVRSNASYELGFLSDMRRLNVAMTRARLGIVVIGNRTTLTSFIEEDDDGSKRAWKGLLNRCSEVEIEED